MKLVYIANVRIPTEKAHGYQICKMCEEFSSQGIEVELWVPVRKNYIEEDAFSFYGVKNNFLIKKIKSFDFFQHERYLGKFSFWLQNICFVIKLFLIKVDKDAIIYTRDSEVSWIFNLKGNKIILESHNWPESKSLLFKYLIKKSDKIITITDKLKELFMATGLPDGKVMVAPDGVDLKKFDINIDKIQIRKKLNLPLDKKIALYSGSLYLYGWKGVDVLLAAAKILPEDCLAVLVGGRKDEVEKIKKEYSGNNLLLVGFKRHEEIPYYLKAADVLVLPNKKGEKISEKYTSPLKLFEYMASGAPIVASDLPSIREILSEKNCLFFQPNDSKDLAKKIEVLLNDKELAFKIAEQAYFDVKNYTWKKRARNIINFIN